VLGVGRDLVEHLWFGVEIFGPHRADDAVHAAPRRGYVQLLLLPRLRSMWYGGWPGYELDVERRRLLPLDLLPRMPAFSCIYRRAACRTLGCGKSILIRTRIPFWLFYVPFFLYRTPGLIRSCKGGKKSRTRPTLARCHLAKEGTTTWFLRFESSEGSRICIGIVYSIENFLTYVVWFIETYPKETNLIGIL
jgi:hypothetical protein